MKQKVEVLVDIYPNHFSKTEPYSYKNIRAVNSDEQGIVDKCIQEMINEDNELLLEGMVVFGNRLLPSDKNKKCLFDIINKNFEFSI